MLKKNWIIRQHGDRNQILALADTLNISNALANLLIQRGITNYFEAEKFFKPSINSLYDPFLMDGMEKASKRVIDAIINNENICIYGDYDVDGTCAAAIMYLSLQKLSANLTVYIPNRLNEGYGISTQSIYELKDKGINLLISVDCGITAVAEINLAKELGIDTIICDHHQPKEELPDAYAILDPLKPGCNYPYKYLSGAGVAFKLVRAIYDRIGKKEVTLDCLDLVALSAAADIVPLTDENRILVKEGIERINSNPRPGIEALIKSARVEKGSLTSGQIVFTLAPRINAVGRMGDANPAFELFITDDPLRAIELANKLEFENFERRKIDEATFTHAVELVENNIDLDNEVAIVLHNDNWHPGVIGIVASRLVEKYYRPAIMLTTIDGIARGSARSINGFNIYQALEETKDLLLQFGGHQAAAGVALEINKIAEFRYKFNKVLKTILPIEDILPEIVVDSKINFNDITPKFIRILDRFAPFGPGNLRPIFLAENISLRHPPRVVGTNHLILILYQQTNIKVFDTVGFNLGNFADLIDKDKHNIDIVFSIDKMMKGDKEFPQLKIKDINIKDKC
ncbi:MAG: single-stranded-DNA-specific exonuclease RecJ [Ignavibacteriales bacterium]|nr:single-stranded-DNA-specific exonuclease RecJ [Ignavibacteriales bacterium]